jgi:hypothetical protein
MAQVRREVEITLHSIDVPVTGTGGERQTTHLVGATLIWPRTGTAQKTSSQSCGLAGGRADFERVNWGRRILFKENVEGRFALGVTLSEALDDEALEKFLRAFAGVVLSVGADAAEAAVPLKPLGKLAAAPLDYAAKEIAKYPGAVTLAEGLAELDAADFPPGGGERLLTVRLTAARRLVRVTRRAVNGKQPARVTRKLLLEKGADNGEVTLLVRTLR